MQLRWSERPAEQAPTQNHNLAGQRALDRTLTQPCQRRKGLCNISSRFHLSRTAGALSNMAWDSSLRLSVT